MKHSGLLYVFVFSFVGIWTFIDSKPAKQARSLSDCNQDFKPLDDFKGDVNNAGNAFWGGSCSSDSDCMSTVSYCSESNKECFPMTWVFILGSLGILLLTALAFIHRYNVYMWGLCLHTCWVLLLLKSESAF